MQSHLYTNTHSQSVTHNTHGDTLTHCFPFIPMDIHRETYRDIYTFTESLRDAYLDTNHNTCMHPFPCVSTRAHTNDHTHRLGLTYALTYKHIDRDIITHRPT